MATTPGIGLQFQPSQALQSFPQQAIGLNQLGQQQRKQQQIMQLNQIPGMVEDGIYTDNGIMALSQIDPGMRDEAVQKRATILNMQSQERYRKAQEDKIRDAERTEMLTDIMSNVYSKYSSAEGSPENRQQVLANELSKQVEDMIKDGRAAKYGMTPQQIAQFRSHTSPDDILVKLLKHRPKEAEFYQAREGARALAGEGATPTAAPPVTGGDTGGTTPAATVSLADVGTDGAQTKPYTPPSIEGTALPDRPEVSDVEFEQQAGEWDKYEREVQDAWRRGDLSVDDYEKRLSEIDAEKERIKAGREKIASREKAPEGITAPEVGVAGAEPDDLIAKARDAETKAKKLRATGMPANIKQAEAYDKQAKKYRDQAQRNVSLAQNERRIDQADKRLKLSEQRVQQIMAGADYEPAEITNMAMDLLMFGKEPRGFGTAGNKVRETVHNARARIAAQLGLTPEEIAMLPQDNKVKMKAVDKLTTWGAFVDKSSEQLVKSLDLAVNYAEKVGPTKMRALNKAILAGQKEFNDPIANAYAVQINTVRTEYSRLMSGPTSNAMLPVEAMKKGDELISAAMDVPTLQEVGRAIRNDARITRTAIDNQIGSLRTGMSGKKETYQHKESDLEPIGGKAGAPVPRETPKAAAPAPMFARNPKTGERIQSNDGGKTWQPAK